MARQIYHTPHGTPLNIVFDHNNRHYGPRPQGPSYPHDLSTLLIVTIILLFRVINPAHPMCDQVQRTS